MTSLDKIIKARSKLMQGNVGMASMLLHLELVEVDSSRCDTMATDGKKIYFFPDFVEGVTEEELQGVLVHEAFHVVYEHPIRRGKRHPKVWNIACDYVINAYLVYDLGMILPTGGLLKYSYKGWTAEKVYQDLIKDQDALAEAVAQIQEDNEDFKPEDSQDSSGEGSSDSDEEGNDEESLTGQGNISEDPADDSDSSETGEIDLDSIPTAIGEVWDATNEEGKPLNEAELQELKGEIQRAVSLADKLEQFGSGTSNVKGGIDEEKDAVVSWKEMLNDFLQSITCNDYSWSRLNKRHSWRGINLPSKVRNPEGGELAIAVDTSGSVSQHELNQFASEIQAMAEDCGLDKVRVCYCADTVVKNEHGEWWDIYELNQGEDLELKVRGGGGTSFDPPFHLFNEWSDDIEDVQAFVYFTDGYGTVEPEQEPECPVVWCVTQKSRYAEELPFGELVYVDTANFY